MIPVSANTRVWLAAGVSDMRRGCTAKALVCFQAAEEGAVGLAIGQRGQDRTAPQLTTLLEGSD